MSWLDVILDLGQIKTHLLCDGISLVSFDHLVIFVFENVPVVLVSLTSNLNPKFLNDLKLSLLDINLTFVVVDRNICIGAFVVVKHILIKLYLQRTIALVKATAAWNQSPLLLVIANNKFNWRLVNHDDLLVLREASTVCMEHGLEGISYFDLWSVEWIPLLVMVEDGSRNLGWQIKLERNDIVTRVQLLIEIEANTSEFKYLFALFAFPRFFIWTVKETWFLLTFDFDFEWLCVNGLLGSDVNLAIYGVSLVIEGFVCLDVQITIVHVGSCVYIVSH